MKRILLLALLLANLALFAWYHWYLLPGQRTPAAAPPLQGQPLELMSELSPAEKKALANAAAQANLAQGTPAPSTAPAPASAPPAATALTPALALACASYGPFPSADAAAQGLTRLKALGLTASQHLVPGKAKLGYWVYLPPFSSRREADAAADLLKRRGVKDIYVVADEANRNAISLGVFSQKDGAEQREKDIKKLGYKVQMAERFRDEPRYWLDARGAESVLPGAEAFKDLADDSSPIGKASTTCSG